MWPGIFEFGWDTGHMIFFGVFYSMAIIIVTSLIYVIATSITDTFKRDSDSHHHQKGESPKKGRDI